jgi:cytochrome c oxidase subunit 2
VPQLAVKKDAIPGFINEMWTQIDEPGTYRGQCTELCGKDHGFMPVVVVAKTENEYAAWVDQQKQLAAAEAAGAEREWDKGELLARGEEVYNSTCAACHQASGQGIPKVFPAIAGSKVATGSVNEHIDLVMGGKEGTAMQAFAAQLSDTDLAAVVSFQRNAFGNDTGDLVQPADIKSARN